MNAPRRRPADPMMERGPGGLQSAVDKLVAELHKRSDGRFIGYHTHNSKFSPAGFPDLVCAGPGGVIAAELKRQREKPTPAQQQWLDLFTLFGIPTYVWRPSDLRSGLINRTLVALTGMPVRQPPADVARLAGIMRAAVSDTITPGLADNLARAVLRAGYTPRGTP